MQQGTTEWLEFRRTGLGSSDMAAILGECPYRTPLSVYRSIVEGVYAKDNFAMARGREWEPVAREYANLQYECTFEPRVAHKIIDGVKFIASLDGDNGNEILEIKVPGKATLELAEKGEIPKHYMIQIQHQLLVTERSCAIFAAFDPDKKETHYVQIAHDLVMQERIKKAGVAFWKNNILQKIEPEPTDGDFLSSEDAGFAVEAANYRIAKYKLTEAEAEMEAAKEALNARLGALPGLVGFGLKLSRYSRKGNVDYAKIPQLVGVDLEPYRKKPSSVFKITEEKT